MLILQIVVIGFVLFLVGSTLWRNRNDLGFIWQTYKRIRPLMFLQVPLMFASVILAYTLLATSIPILNWGWANLFFPGGGNIILAPVMPTDEAPTSADQPSAQGEQAGPPITLGRILKRGWFFFLLLPALPFFAHAEEVAYRKGVWRWGDIIKRSVQFGFVHLWMGIPIAAGIALILPGLVFGFTYRRAFCRLKEVMTWEQAEEEATLKATALHTLYNTAVVALLFWIFVL